MTEKVDVNGLHIPNGNPQKLRKLSNEKSIPTKCDENTASLDSEKNPQKYPKKKVALLLGYNGTGYQGMQINPNAKTIESDFLEAIYKADAVSEDNKFDFSKIGYQRTARTDKGVHAIGQVVSCKLRMVPNLLERLNQNLPPQIRVFDIRKVTRGFNCKNACDARTYEYYTPTYVFADSYQPSEFAHQENPSPLSSSPSPQIHLGLKKYRISQEKISLIRKVLKLFEGTHNFHNYTSGRNFHDSSAKRFIMQFDCSEPFVSSMVQSKDSQEEEEGIEKDSEQTEQKSECEEEDLLEMITFKVKGQSFILHQIRKMVGLCIAIVRGDVSMDVFEKTFQEPFFPVPKAPGLGLVLSKCHFEYYNKKVREENECLKKKEKTQKNGLKPNSAEILQEEKELLDWTQDADLSKRLDSFKTNWILAKMIETELKEKIMLQWLDSLALHNFTAPTPISSTTA